MLKEFKEFALRGNVVDMAVGIMVGAAFTGIVTSLVNDILTPPLSVLLGEIDLRNLFITLRGTSAPTLDEAKELGAITWNYGLFLNNFVSFLLISFATFIIVKQINILRRKSHKQSTPTTRPCPQCLSQIHKDAKRCAFCTEVVHAK
jgi:large conductance mechanosensitive channel